MILILLTLPLIAFFVSGLYGRIFGCKGSSYLATLLLFFTLIISSNIIFRNFGLSEAIYRLELGQWLCLDWFVVSWALYIDSLSVSTS